MAQFAYERPAQKRAKLRPLIVPAKREAFPLGGIIRSIKHNIRKYARVRKQHEKSNNVALLTTSYKP